MTLYVYGVTICLTGVFACDVNLVLIVMKRWVGEKFALCLCLPPSEVKPWFAPSEVHYFLFRPGGGKCVFRLTLFCGFENTGQSLQSDCLFAADLIKWARRLRV
jgi:hypothetical protein